MLFIDMTAQLTPIVYGLIATLAVSGVALFASAVAPVLTARLQRRTRPHLALSRRPVLAGQTH